VYIYSEYSRPPFTRMVIMFGDIYIVVKATKIAVKDVKPV